jgi:hypothetical protein
MKMIKRKSRNRYMSLLLLPLWISGCAGGRPTDVLIDSVASLVQALRDAGAEVQIDDRAGQPLMDLLPQSVRLGGEQLWIYSSAERLDTGKVNQTLAQEPRKQFIWVTDHLIVQYKGNDGGTILLLDSFLGDAVIKPSAAGDEPYPPAIPAALSVVAVELGVPPAEVEVLSYEMTEWPNACLGFEQPDELCVEVITPGWRIALRHDAAQIEVHTDLLGETIRWRQQ